MQFFPPVQPGLVQSAQFGGMTGSLETRAGQDFEDLLSVHLNQTDAGSDSSFAGSFAALTEAIPVESAKSAEPDRSEARQKEVRSDDHGASVREKQKQGQAQAREENSSLSAKPATGEKEHAHVDDKEIPTAVSLKDAVVDEDAVIAEEVETLLYELCVLLSDAAEAKNEGQGQMRDTVAALSARIQMAQDLLQQFRQSGSADRAELGVSLAATGIRDGQGQTRDTVATLNTRMQTTPDLSQQLRQSDSSVHMELTRSLAATGIRDGQGQTRDTVAALNTRMQTTPDLSRQLRQSDSSVRTEQAKSLAVEVKSEGQGQARDTVAALSARIQTAQDLLQQFRQSGSADRAELGVSLAATGIRDGQGQARDTVAALNTRMQTTPDLSRQLRQSDSSVRTEQAKSLAVEVKSEGQGQTRDTVAALNTRMQTTQDLSRQLRQSDASARMELARSLAVEVKSEEQGQTRDTVADPNPRMQTTPDLSRQLRQNVPVARTEQTKSLAAEVKSEEQGQTRDTVADPNPRIQTAQGLSRQLRQNVPAARTEQARSLSIQLRTLRNEVAAFDRSKSLNESSSLQHTSVLSARTAQLIDRMEHVARRIETIGSAPQTVQAATVSALDIESRKVKSTGSRNAPESAAQTKLSRYGGSRGEAPRAAVQVQASDTSKRTSDSESQADQARPNASFPPSQSQAPQSRSAKLQPDRSPSESTPKVQALSLEESDAPARKHPMPSVSSQEVPVRENNTVRRTGAKTAAATGAETVPVANVKSSVKDHIVSSGKLESGVESKAGVDSAVISHDPSATKSGGGSQEPRPDFFKTSDRDKPASSKTVTSGAGATIGTESESATSGLQTPIQSRLEAPVNARTSEVYRQVENGAFKNLGQGLKQLVIRLDPVDLGHVSVILQVRGKEVQAVIRASSQESSQALSEQMGQLRTQLEAQGLKVGRLEVQAQLSDSQTQPQWEGAEQHNRFQENRELALSALRWRTLGQADSTLARDVQNVLQREKNSSSGLDIFA